MIRLIVTALLVSPSVSAFDFNPDVNQLINRRSRPIHNILKRPTKKESPFHRNEISLINNDRWSGYQEAARTKKTDDDYKVFENKNYLRDNDSPDSNGLNVANADPNKLWHWWKYMEETARTIVNDWLYPNLASKKRNVFELAAINAALKLAERLSVTCSSYEYSTSYDNVVTKSLLEVMRSPNDVANHLLQVLNFIGTKTKNIDQFIQRNSPVIDQQNQNLNSTDPQNQALNPIDPQNQNSNSIEPQNQDLNSTDSQNQNLNSTDPQNQNLGSIDPQNQDINSNNSQNQIDENEIDYRVLKEEYEDEDLERDEEVHEEKENSAEYLEGICNCDQPWEAIFEVIVRPKGYRFKNKNKKLGRNRNKSTRRKNCKCNEQESQSNQPIRRTQVKPKLRSDTDLSSIEKELLDALNNLGLQIANAENLYQATQRRAVMQYLLYEPKAPIDLFELIRTAAIALHLITIKGPCKTPDLTPHDKNFLVTAKEKCVFEKRGCIKKDIMDQLINFYGPIYPTKPSGNLKTAIKGLDGNYAVQNRGPPAQGLPSIDTNLNAPPTYQHTIPEYPNQSYFRSHLPYGKYR